MASRSTASCPSGGGMGGGDGRSNARAARQTTKRAKGGKRAFAFAAGDDCCMALDVPHSCARAAVHMMPTSDPVVCMPYTVER